MDSRIGFFLVGVASFGAGVLTGRRIARPPAIGGVYHVGAETFVDGPFFDLLASKLGPPRDVDEWTVFDMRGIRIALKRLTDKTLVPGQIGALYLVRNVPPEPGSMAATGGRFGNDEHVQLVLGDFVRLGLIRSGVWESWREVIRGEETA